MNREIKFRGKTPDGKWITGSETFIHDGDGVWLHDGCDVVKVMEDTVGQFTGLRDSRGIEIYEGDIVIVYRYGQSYMGKVVFKDAAFGIETKLEGMFYTGDFHYADVLGNVFDNSGMLKGGEK